MGVGRGDKCGQGMEKAGVESDVQGVEAEEASPLKALPTVYPLNCHCQVNNLITVVTAINFMY